MSVQRHWESNCQPFEVRVTGLCTAVSQPAGVQRVELGRAAKAVQHPAGALEGAH